MTQDSSETPPCSLLGFSAIQSAAGQLALTTLSMGATTHRSGVEFTRLTSQWGFDLLDRATDADVDVDDAREAVDEALHTTGGLSFAAERGLSATVNATTDATEELATVCATSAGSTADTCLNGYDVDSRRLLTDGGE